MIKKGITTKENVLLGKGLNPADVNTLDQCNDNNNYLRGLLQFEEAAPEEEEPEPTRDEVLAGATLDELEDIEVIESNLESC